MRILFDHTNDTSARIDCDCDCACSNARDGRLASRWVVPMVDWARQVPGIISQARTGDTLVVHSREALAFVATFAGNSGKVLRVILEDERVANEKASL